MSASYEKLGVFYLGKNYDVESSKVGEVPTLLRSKDLTTHAVCLGMTGSGKTGLCVSLLEEAAIDSIPVIAIDPKGDISNVLLGFENMKPKDFEPWVSESEAEQKGVSVSALSGQKAKLWSEGIKSWDQTTDRISKIKENVDIRVYTPGSDAGLQLSLYGSFKAPKKETIEDPNAFAEAIEGTVTSYLSVVDKSSAESGTPEHSFLSEILNVHWSKGESLTFEDVIGAIQNPPFEKIGALSLENFFPKKDRTKLAMKFNALYASPQFKAWSKGSPVSIPKMLYGKGGKPQVSIISVAHLEEEERIFFVSKVLNELVSWTRKQPGTSSLRALLYMDEIYGYFPPTGNPPTKKPMLTLLKQARAQGVGVVLATQNPVDLDYKGLSNTGTWFIGRLQTEQDKNRLLDGLKSLGDTSGVDLGKAISSLDKRVFLMHSVHREQPEIFHTRWALSYLSGPITLDKIKTLMAPFKSNATVEKVMESETKKTLFDPKSLPKEVSQKLLEDSDKDSYKPYFGAVTSTFFNHRKSGEEKTVEQVWLSDMAEDADFELSQSLEEDLFKIDSENDYTFKEVPSFAQEEKIYTKKAKEAKADLYRESRLTLFECSSLKEFSEFNETEDEFRGRLSHAVREKKDEAIDKLNSKYEKKIDMIEKRVMRAEQKVEKEKEQYANKKTNTLLGIGTAVASIFLGGKALSGTNARRAGSVLKSAGSASKEKSDIGRAEEQLKDYESDLEDMRNELEDEILKIEDEFSVDNLEVKEIKVKPTKTNIEVKWCGLVWK